MGFSWNKAAIISNEFDGLIETTCRVNGWLIFATHDVCANPTRFGCQTDFFARVVETAEKSGAALVSVGKALDIAGIGNHPQF